MRRLGAGHDLYHPHRPELAELPARTVLTVDGRGGPDSPAFGAAVGALYAAFGADAPLEGTWWSGEDRPAERVARLVHLGPYADEGPSLEALRAFAGARGLRIADAHTETYLTDPRTTPPAELRTELRVPVA